MTARDPSTREPNIQVLPNDVRAWLFLALCCLIAVALVGTVMWWRTRRLLANMRMQQDDVLREHERVCEELHDMLVQSTQGFMLTVQTAAHLVPADSPARPMLDRALERADEVLVGARDRVEQLRRRWQRDRTTIAG